MAEDVILVRPGKLYNLADHGIVELESPYWPEIDEVKVTRARPEHHVEALQVRQVPLAERIQPAKARTVGPQIVITGGLHGARFEVQTAEGYSFQVRMMPRGTVPGLAS